MNENFSPALTQIINNFDSPGSPAQARLIELLQQAPLLLENLEKAVALGSVKHLGQLDEYGAGAAYIHGKATIELDVFNLASSAASMNHLVLFQLGHEIQHALDAENFGKQLAIGKEQMQQALQSGAGNKHFYSDALKTQLEAYREYEAKAHIGGWNMFIDYMKQKNPDVNLKDLYNSMPDKKGEYIRDFVDKKGWIEPIEYTFKADIEDDNLYINASTIKNIEAIKQHYFDKAPSLAQLGSKKNLDYLNLYGAEALGEICQREREHPEQAGKIMLDMQRLGLDPARIEAEGFNAGGPGQRCEYYDTRDPDTPRYLNHTAPAGKPPTREEAMNERYRQEFGGENYHPSGHAEFDLLFEAYLTGNPDEFTRAMDIVSQSPLAKEMWDEAERIIEQEQLAKQPEQAQQQPLTQQHAMTMKRAFHDE